MPAETAGEVLARHEAVLRDLRVRTGSGLAGPAGPTGASGLSAYQVAVANGYAGTVTQWLASLIGAPGPTGPAGPAGADATITGATATGLAAGAAPTVTAGGTPGARSFTFGIPAGATGATGPTGPTGPQGPAGATYTTPDTGWVNIGNNSPTGGPSRYRNRDGTVHVHIDSLYGAAFNQNFVLFTLPVGSRPANPMWVTIPYVNFNGVFYLFINTNGDVASAVAQTPSGGVRGEFTFLAG